MNFLAVLVVTTACLLTAGCGESGSGDSKTSDAGTKVSSSAKNAGDTIKADANHAVRVGEDDLESAKINSAFSSAAGLQASGLKVNTDMSAKTITVTGQVPTLAQRDQERSIAKGIAGSEFKVKDTVTVAAKAK